MFRSPALSFIVGGALPSAVLSGLPAYVVAGTTYALAVAPTAVSGADLRMYVTCVDATSGAQLPDAIWRVGFDRDNLPWIQGFSFKVPTAPALTQVRCQVTDDQSNQMAGQMINPAPITVQVIAATLKVTAARAAPSAMVYPGDAVAFNLQTSGPVGTGGIVVSAQCLRGGMAPPTASIGEGASSATWAATAGAVGLDSCVFFVSGGPAQSQFDSYVTPVALNVTVAPAVSSSSAAAGSSSGDATGDATGSSGPQGASSSTGNGIPGCPDCGAMHAASAPSVLAMVAAAALSVALWAGQQ